MVMVNESESLRIRVETAIVNESESLRIRRETAIVNKSESLRIRIETVIVNESESPRLRIETLRFVETDKYKNCGKVMYFCSFYIIIFYKPIMWLYLASSTFLSRGFSNTAGLSMILRSCRKDNAK